jgi:hypothetical protein
MSRDARIRRSEKRESPRKQPNKYKPRNLTTRKKKITEEMLDT